MTNLPLLSNLQLSLLGIVSIEVDNVLPVGNFSRPVVLTVPATTLSDWYKNQPSMKWVRADQALNYSRGAGVVVADINAKLDVAHPALVGHLTSGYDFVSARAAYAGTLNQSSSSFLDQSSSSFLDQSSSSFLDQSSSSFLDEGAAILLDGGNPATVTARSLPASSPRLRLIRQSCRCVFSMTPVRRTSSRL